MNRHQRAVPLAILLADFTVGGWAAEPERAFLWEQPVWQQATELLVDEALTHLPSPRDAVDRAAQRRLEYTRGLLLLNAQPNLPGSDDLATVPWRDTFTDGLIYSYNDERLQQSAALSLCAAYLFARYRMPCSGLLRAAFLTLMLMPSVANIVPLLSLLVSLNLTNTLRALIIPGIAGGQVFNIYVLRQFIEEVPSALFEAAEIDGASHFQQMYNVVIPQSGPILGTLVTRSFLGSRNDFLMPFIVLRDRERFTLGVGLVYLDGEYVKPRGRIMAAYLLASLPLIVLFLFTMKLSIRGLSSGAVKG